MIEGLLLLYIGIRFKFPMLYILGCWLLVIVKALAAFSAFMSGFNDGKSGTDKSV